MKRSIIILALIFLPIVLALEECPRYAFPKDIPCEIRSTWTPATGCYGNLSYYNETGNYTYFTLWSNSSPYCVATFNYTALGTVCGNSTIEDSCITIQGDDEQMIIAITLFLLGINVLVFALPFWVKFSKSEAGDYVVRRMMWIGAILLLWFNTTLFRELASKWGLGIDNFLLGYWWIFTMAAFSTIFIMTYVAVVGAIKLTKEAQLKKRMGDDYDGY